MAVNAAMTLAPFVLGAFHRKKKGPNMNAILARYRASRPEGYVTDADKAQAERVRTKVAGAATAAAARARQLSQRQITARGLEGPAAAALEGQATDIEAAGAEEAARNSADVLDRAYNSNLGYERGKSDTAFGAEMGLAQQEAIRGQAQETSFWNSMLEAIPAVAGGLSSFGRPSGADIVGKATRADPSILDTGNPDIGPRPVSIPRPTVYR